MHPRERALLLASGRCATHRQAAQAQRPATAGVVQAALTGVPHSVHTSETPIGYPHIAHALLRVLRQHVRPRTILWPPTRIVRKKTEFKMIPGYRGTIGSMPSQKVASTSAGFAWIAQGRSSASMKSGLNWRHGTGQPTHAYTHCELSSAYLDWDANPLNFSVIGGSACSSISRSNEEIGTACHDRRPGKKPTIARRWANESSREKCANPSSRFTAATADFGRSTWPKWLTQITHATT
jgi:hypothetical protein